VPESRRVVITGIGAVTPIGLGAEGLWDGLQRRESAIRCITRFDPSMFKSRIAGEVDGFFPSDHIEERRVRRLDRFSQFSVAATRMALRDAQIDHAKEDPDRVGAMMGTALGGVAHGEAQYHNFLTTGPRTVDPALALTVFAGAASCNIAIEFGFTGPNSTNGMSCASGAIAIGEGFRAIARGEADVMVAGGAEAPLAPLCFGAFAIIRAMSTRNDDPARASRPFDQDRDGFVMAEGAAVLVLEERGRALARGAPIYAEICGFGLTNDAHHMTAPRPDGRQAARAMRNALTEAHVNPHEVGYINAHGSSTPLNDSTETASIKQVFGEHAYRNQGLLRTCPGSQRSHRGRDLCALEPERLVPTNREPAYSRSRLRSVARHRCRNRAYTRLPPQQLLWLRRDQRGAGLSEDLVSR
jgi:3-oxoacyl-[acyl-carrier-protein] synthase II